MNNGRHKVLTSTIASLLCGHGTGTWRRVLRTLTQVQADYVQDT